MKVELSARDIELILSLIAASEPDDVYFGASAFFSIEEISLIEKLEKALKDSGTKDADILDTGSSGYCH